MRSYHAKEALSKITMFDELQFVAALAKGTSGVLKPGKPNQAKTLGGAEVECPAFTLGGSSSLRNRQTEVYRTSDLHRIAQPVTYRQHLGAQLRMINEVTVELTQRRC